MEPKKVLLKLTSKNQDELINPYELLLPVNAVVNLVNFLKNMEEILEDWEAKARKDNKEPDYDKFILKRPSNWQHHISSSKDGSVKIKAISKKSPYWVDLVIQTSPYVLFALRQLINSATEKDVDRLIVLLNDIPGSERLTDDLKRKLIRKILRLLSFLLGFVDIDWNDDNN